MGRKQRLKVLCVDDDPAILQGLRLHLRRHYEVSTAESGKEALELLQGPAPFAVVLSDMRMPEMNGAELLCKVKEVSPQSVRMLLTGQSDLQNAIKAVNEGQIFRFLTKPCPPPHLKGAFERAAAQYELLSSEKSLLEETFQGSIQALAAMLSATHPAIFGRALRLQKNARQFAEVLRVENAWQIETAAMFSQFACISLPPRTLEKLYKGKPVTDEEMLLIRKLPNTVQRFLEPIPRLDEVCKIIAALTWNPTPGTRESVRAGARNRPQGTRILEIIMDYDVLEREGLNPVQAIDLMRKYGKRYDEVILDAFAHWKGASSHAETPSGWIRFSDIEPGMIFLEDVRTPDGGLLIARGHEVAEGIEARMDHFPRELLDSLVRTRRSDQGECAHS